MSQAKPMPAADRLGAYQAQNNGRPLTPRQSRRCAKKINRQRRALGIDTTDHGSTR